MSLDAQRIGTHGFDALAALHPKRDRVHLAYGVGDGVPWACRSTLRTAPMARSRLRMSFMASKMAEYVHPVGRGALHEAVHHVVRVVPVAEQVLTPQQHLLRGVLGMAALSLRSRSQGSSPR